MKTSASVYRMPVKHTPTLRRNELGYAPPIDDGPLKRRFVAYFFFVGWDCISFGLHVSLLCPNIEVHVPFGFVRIGWQFR